MFTDSQINLHNACADVLKSYQKHLIKIQHCNNALDNPGLYRHYTPEEYNSIKEDSLSQIEEIKATYIQVMKRMVSAVMDFQTKTTEIAWVYTNPN